MAVGSVTSTGTSGSSASTAGSADKTMGMSTNDFYKLLIAEMRYQDPMQPMDNSKMVEQVAGIRSIEASTTMSSTLQTVTRQQNYATAASLMGKLVTATIKDAAGKDQEISGVVTRVMFEKNGNVVLELDDGATKLPLETVTKVENPAAAAAAAVAPPAAQQNQSLWQKLFGEQKAA